MGHKITRVFDKYNKFTVDCLDKLLNIEYIKIDEISVNEKERIRTFTGDDISDLKESIQEVGLIHPIIVNKNKKLIAGYRRLKACKELGWLTIPSIVKTNTNELEDVSIELHENTRRKNLSPYEIDIAIAKWKRIYQKLYPETKFLAHTRSGKRKSSGRIFKLDQMAESARGKTEEEDQRKKKRCTKRFTQIAAEYTRLSERTIRDRVQVGESILRNNFDNETIESYKKGNLSHALMLKKDQERRKRDKLERIKEFTNSKKVKIFKKKFKIDKNGINNLNSMLKLDVCWCKNCLNAKISSCPDCGKQIILCDKGYFMLKNVDSQACKDYKN